MACDHDGDYKDIFSHPEAVRDLLLEFVPGDWIQHVDFTTLERVNASYVSDKGHHRHDDMVWKVRLAHEWLYVYVLLEFQSDIDRWMALRLLVYVGLLYQDLVKSRQLGPQEKLPAVLPIVLHSGIDKWTAATDLAELLLPAPGGLERYQPSQQYLLIDENTLDPDVLGSKRNLAAALFRLEHSRTPEDLRRVIAGLRDWLWDKEQEPVRQSLKRWTLRILRRKLKTDSIPEVADLLEIDSMLATRVENWTDEWMRQGVEKGLERGRIQGETRLLRKLIEQRFGQVPDWVENKLSQATEEELMRWGEGIFNTSTLEQLFTR